MRICILLAILAVQPLLGADVAEVPLTRSDTAYPASSASGVVLLPARHSTLTVPLPDGTTGKCKLFVLFDPASGQYLWRHLMVTDGDDAREEAYQSLLSHRGNNSALYVSADRITWFWMAGLDLSIQQSSGPVPSLDRAYDQALTALRAHWLDYFNWKHYVFHNVEVWKVAERSFYESYDSRPLGSAAIQEVRRDGGDWVFTLVYKWKAVLTLDSTFHPKSMQRVVKE